MKIKQVLKLKTRQEFLFSKIHIKLFPTRFSPFFQRLNQAIVCVQSKHAISTHSTRNHQYVNKKRKGELKMMEWDSYSCWYMSNYMCSREFFVTSLWISKFFLSPKHRMKMRTKKVDKTFEFTSLKTFKEQERRKKCSFFRQLKFRTRD